MALPTTEHHVSPPQQHPSPGVGQQGTPPPPSGVGMMGAQPVVEPTGPTKPVLFDDIDPVLLVRLYPGAKDAADMRAQAMAQGVKTAAEGAETVASQNEPVLVESEPVPPPPPPQHRSGPGPHREA